MGRKLDDNIKKIRKKTLNVLFPEVDTEIKIDSKISKEIGKSSYNKMYYYPNKLFSFNPDVYWFYICIGSRGRGKTVSAWRWVLKRFIKHDELFVWLRLTEAPIKKASRNQGSTLAPEFLLKQLGIRGLSMRGNVIYCTIEDGDKIVTKICGIMDAISTFYTSKGQDMSAYSNVVFDEINRESGERSTFDVVRAFINQIETLARMRKLRVLMLGNTILDTSDILGIFNFQPKKFGLYKLTRKHTIVEYLDDSEEFKKARKESLAGVLLGDNENVASSFTNKSISFADNIEKHDHRYKEMFSFFIGEFKAYGIYQRKGDNEGLFIGEVRNDKLPQYKISPFMNCKGKYDDIVYKTFYELVSQNMLWYDSTMTRSRFVTALKKNRTAIM